MPRTVNWRTLRSFLNDPNAPEGQVYFIDDKPKLQIDLFARFYSVFWLGSADIGTSQDSFINLLDEAKSAGSLFSHSGDVSSVLRGFVSVVKPRERGDGRLIKQEEPMKYPTYEASVLLRRRLKVFLNAAEGQSATAIHIELKGSIRRREVRLALWADTPKSPKSDKEIGITSNLPFTDAFKTLLLQTSTAVNGLSAYDFDLLMYQLMSFVSNRGYYR